MKFYGQFDNPSVDEYLYTEFFKNKNDGFFIECGAANGVADCSCKFFEEFKGWKGINIEAHPGIFKSLKINRPSSINLNLALTSPEEEGLTLNFNAYDFQDNAKILIDKFGPHMPIGFLDSAKKHRHNISLKGTKQGGVFQVQGITYKTLIKQYNINKVDLFVLDVEGSELEVIKGMKDCQVLPKVFCIETNKLNLNNLTTVLKEFNYEFHSTKHVNSHFILKD